MAMDVAAFIGPQSPVSPLAEQARALGARKEFSDLLDADGNQYVDLVMEGGGVLGIALVGYTYILEQAGIRFLSIGGTSAGAINAMLMAGVARPAESKTDRILPMLAALDMFSFVDGDKDAKSFVRGLVEKIARWRLAWRAWRVTDNLREDLGLNPGDRFEAWLAEQLASCGVRTTRELRERMQALPEEFFLRVGADREPLAAEKRPHPRLKVISAEVNTRSKITFPEMGELFWAQPDEISPAKFVRCSMSIPYFFHPFRIRDLPVGAQADALWKKTVGFDGGAPREALFVDGGILSNFPINQFHVRDRAPRAPTLGIKLDNDRAEVHEVDGPLSLFGGIFNAARQCLDLDFFLRHPDYRQLVGTIPTGAHPTAGTGAYRKGHNWLNFFLEDEAKVDLFVRGAQTALKFLESFDWRKYRDARARMLTGATFTQPAAV